MQLSNEQVTKLTQIIRDIHHHLPALAQFIDSQACLIALEENKTNSPLIVGLIRPLTLRDFPPEVIELLNLTPVKH